MDGTDKECQGDVSRIKGTRGDSQDRGGLIMQSMQGSDQDEDRDDVVYLTIGQLLAQEMDRELRGDLYELEFTYTNCCDSHAYKHIHDDILEVGLR